MEIVKSKAASPGYGRGLRLPAPVKALMLELDALFKKYAVERAKGEVSVLLKVQSSRGITYPTEKFDYAFYQGGAFDDLDDKTMRVTHTQHTDLGEPCHFTRERKLEVHEYYQKLFAREKLMAEIGKEQEKERQTKHEKSQNQKVAGNRRAAKGPVRRKAH